MRSLQVLIADDHKIFRMGMVITLRSIDNIEKIFEADDGDSAVATALTQPVDIVFMDIRMPGISGIEATKIIKREKPQVQVIAVSMFDDQSYITEMFTSGASAYLLKNTDTDEIEEAIMQVMEGEKYFSRDVSKSMLKNLLHKTNAPQNETGNFQLTEREIQILRLLSKGLANKQIASELKLSERTVEGYRSKMLQKYDQPSMTALISHAIRHRLIDGL